MSSLEFKDIIIVIIIIIAATLAAGLSVYQYIDSVQKDNKNEQLQKDLITAQKQALEKAENLEKANEEIKDKANALIKTQGELNSLQNETLKKVMGYGYAFTKIGIIAKNEFKLFVESKSDYPLYETEIVVYDQDKINNCPKVKSDNKDYVMLDCYSSAGMEFPIFTLNMRKIRPLGYTGNLDKERHILIKITTKHNVTYQYSILKVNPDGNNLIHYYRVFENHSGAYNLLEKDNSNINEDIFEKHFSYRKDVPVLFN